MKYGVIMSATLPEGALEKLQVVMDAERVIDAQSRQEMVRTASLLADALAGKLHTVSPVKTELLDPTEKSAGPVPAEIPLVTWKNAVYLGKDEAGADIYDGLDMIGTIGDFASDQVAEAGVATIFNIGFYAGVLAAKAGIVDIDQFMLDSRLPNSLDFVD